MKKHLILFTMLLGVWSSSDLFGQVVVYSEDFDGPLTWTLNTDMVGEGANPCLWYVSCEEEGVGDGACATDCAAGDQTLHVSTNLADLGAAYVETGMGLSTTNRRAESPDISTVGDVDLTLSFDMIGQGGGTDFAELFYSTDGGASWVSLATPLTSLCCGGVPCTGTEEGLWQNNTYALPAACEGIPNLRISFVWQSVDDGVATDPSFAVDNILIEKPVVVVPGGPTALFVPEDVTICVGETITYTDASTTGDVISAWNWNFDGGMPGSALGVGPHNVTYGTAGVYTTTLTVTDGIGSHDTSFTVTVQAGPYAGADASADLCEGATLDLNTLIPGADAGGTWTETSAAPSGTFTAGTGTLDGTGLPIGNVYTFEYETLPGVAPCPDPDVSVVTITIIDCAPLDAEFTSSELDLEICVGDCITFTDASTGTGIIGWAWTFSDPDIAPIAGDTPGAVCFPNEGAVDVTLTITDGTDSNDETITITVHPLPTVTATASSESICEGAEVTLTGTGDALTYTWTGGVTDGVAFTPASTTTYTVTGDNNFGCESTDAITVAVIECDPLAAGFEFNNVICVGECHTFTDTSTGTPVSWFWDWGGGVIPWVSTVQNPRVCFTIPGVFDVQLTVTDAAGESSSTTQSITVFEASDFEARLDTIIDLGGTADLIAVSSTPGGTYLWEPDENLECTDCPITTANPLQDTEYYVTYTDFNGCVAKDTVKVFVNFIEGIGVPEAFSPNDDGANDVLYVRGHGLENITFTVYNKYGERVFESQTQSIGWDGMFMGRPENPGVFTWVLEYEFINGKRGTRKGKTTLIR